MHEESETPPQRRSLNVLTLFGASLCWSAALAITLLVDMRSETEILFLQRLLLILLVVGAGWFTFLPIERSMELPCLTCEGTAGMALLFYTLACVPPPTMSPSALPDIPVYYLIIVALFWSSSAIALPFIYAIRKHTLKQRSMRLHIGHARRQAYEVGLLAVCVIILAGLHVLTWISFFLLLLILLTIELIIQGQWST